MVKKHSSAGWTWLRPLTMFTLLMFVASFDTSSYSLKWSNFLAVWVWNLLFFFTYIYTTNLNPWKLWTKSRQLWLLCPSARRGVWHGCWFYNTNPEANFFEHTLQSIGHHVSHPAFSTWWEGPRRWDYWEHLPKGRDPAFDSSVVEWLPHTRPRVLEDRD